MLAPAGAALAQVSSTSGGTAVPEPTNITLFAIGLAGLIIGRRVAKRKD
ncbi:MAG: PEP-CTERM sorting domain-containing protein [Novosphingobium sp.]